jgi:poly(hydroxyalkanoate) depolymerase family esterase
MQLARSLVLVAALAGASRTADAALTQVTNFGSNPGALSMYEYVPAGLPPGRPVVVVLHGCTKTAADMQAAGWNALADQYKLTIVYPQQEPANNALRCFNWAGEYGDLANLVRGQGENQSIIEMVDKALAAHGGDASKVYVVGFSAGAAFAAVLAATWPERFAAVSINAGVPYRCATSVNEALSCQLSGVTKTAAQWGDLVRGAHLPPPRPYPRVQIWAGSSDTMVVPMNLTELAKQWTDAHGTDDTADSTETIGDATHATYTKDGTVVVETYRVTGMGHAVAIGNDPAGACPSTAGTYFADKGICATLRAAMFFGLTGDPGSPDTQAPAASSPGNGPGAGTGGGCGCSVGAGGGGSGVAMLGVGLVAVLRRLRRRDRA